MAQKIQTRHDTAANWTSVNPVLMVGEQGYETDTGKVKVGDGTTAWASLAYNLVAGNVSGTVAIANGGTGQTAKAAAFDALSPTAATGDVIYFGATSNVALAGNTTTTKKFLAQTGTGTASAAPAWATIAAGDVPTLNQNTTGTAANVTGVVALVNGGTGTAAASANAAFNALSPLTTKGDIVVYSTINARLVVGGDGQVLTADSTQALGLKWATPTAADAPKNFLLNGDFILWQRGTSTTVANGATAYQADRWYAKNSLGTNGVITFSQVTGTQTGSKYGASVKITTAPTALQTNGCELYQTLENSDSLALIGQSACFSAQVKAQGNVTQVGLQFLYATSEAKVGTTIGSEQLVTVNSSTFSLASIAGQALGTSMTTAGVVGVRIRITAVSAGNTYDLNNGFVVEQAIVNLGAAVANFKRAGVTTEAELALCQRFCELIGGSAGSTIASGFMVTTTLCYSALIFRTTKRAAPSATISSQSGFQLATSASNPTSTAVSLTEVGTNSANLNVTVAAQTLATPCTVRTLTTNTIILDSEI